MSRLSSGLLGVSFMAILVSCSVAAGECDLASAKTRFPAAQREFGNWMARTNREISPALTERWMLEFCDAAIEVEQKNGLTDRAVDEKAAVAVAQFLDQETSSERASATMTAILGSKLGVAGFARPVAKVSVKVAMHYTQDLDQILVNGKALRRAAFLVLPPGKVRIQAMRSGAEICSAELDLVEGVDGNFTC